MTLVQVKKHVEDNGFPQCLELHIYYSNSLLQFLLFSSPWSSSFSSQSIILCLQ